MARIPGVEARVSKASWPIARGFDRSYGTISGAGNYFFPAALVEDERPIAPEGEDYYYTDAVSERAAGFVRELTALYEEWAAGAAVAPWPWVIRLFRWGVAVLGLVGLAAAALVFAWL